MKPKKYRKADPAVIAARSQAELASISDFEEAVRHAPIDEIEAIRESIAAGQKALDDYYATLSRLSPDHPPAVSGIEEELAAYEALFRQLTAGRRPANPESQENPGITTLTDSGNGTAEAKSSPDQL